MSSADHTRGRIPALKSILVKLLLAMSLCAVSVAGSTEYLVWRASHDIATRAAAGQARQVAAMLADISVGALRFRDTDGLAQRLDDVISHSTGQIAGAAVFDAAGDPLVSHGSVRPDVLAQAARNALASGEAGLSVDGFTVANAIVNPKSGQVIGAVALRADPGPLRAMAGTASVRAMQVGLVVLAVALVSMLVFLRSAITRPLARKAESMARIAEGEYDIHVEDGSRSDEIGELSRNLEVFREIMQKNAGAARINLFRSAAFSQTNSAMMMVDHDRTIIDQNDACHQLMQDYAEEFRKHWDDFDPDALVGDCIDRFHNGSGRHDMILSDPSKMPYTADISIGDLKIELKISAILDQDGMHAGNILEWRDVGAERLSGGILKAIGQNQGLIEYSRDGRIIRANEIAQDCFDLGDAGPDWNFAATFADKTEGDSRLDRIAAGEAEVGRLRRRSLSGREVWTDSSINLVTDGNGLPYRIVEIATDITAAEVARRTAEAERDRMVRAQEQVVDALKRGLGALAEGDLAHKIEDAFDGDYERLRKDFNKATEKLRSSLGRMILVAVNVGESTQEISQASDDLSRRTEAQATTLANTAAALDELTTTVRSSAGSTQEADKAVAGAKESAKTGGAVVLEAVSAMKEIEKSSAQISQIIGVIDDIAFQTNLLALNAGVEAARAGDAGRGFAVVASEVRALAQRSSEAAREIKELISASSTHVGRGVELVDRTGAALRDIVDSVENISIQVSEIATSSQQQAMGLGEINEGMTRLDTVTQQNAAMVEESNAAAHTLRKETETLTGLIGFFRTGTEAELADLNPAGDTIRRPRGPDAAAKPAPEPSPRPRMRVAVGAEDLGCADFAETRPSDWEDF